MNIPRIIKLLTFFSCWFIVANVTGQWSPDPSVNNPICTASYSQNSSLTISDGFGGAIIIWIDRRNGSENDIYAQRVNANGNIQWAIDGIPICTATGDQDDVTIIPDGNGGAIITWQDLRSGVELDIYSQRINSNGIPQWTANGEIISNAISNQKTPTITSDGNGGAIITWFDLRNGTDYDIYSQRINSNGLVQWLTNGVAVSTATNYQWGPTIASDGLGGAIITWFDYRNASTQADIYAQRIDLNGAPLWIPNGVPICTADSLQSFPSLVSDGSGGAIITWNDVRSGMNFDIYAQRVNGGGIVQWPIDGIPICVATFGQISPIIVTDCVGGAILTWYDNRSGFSSDIYSQRINSNGIVQWTIDGVPICVLPNEQSPNSMISDGTGGAIIVWSDERTDTSDIYVQHINALGLMQEQINGEIVSSAPSKQDDPAVVSDGTGATIIAWSDFRNGNYYDIYAQGVSLSIGIDEPNQNSVRRIYPNPSTGIFNLDNSVNEGIVELLIHSSLGNIIYRTNLMLEVGQMSSFDLSNYSKGIYYYEIVTDSKIIASGKLVLQ